MLRFRDAERQLELGVHDLIDAGPPMGNLQLAVAWSARLRMKAGVEVHGRYQRDRALEDESFQREVTVRHRLVVRAEALLEGLSGDEGGVGHVSHSGTGSPRSRRKAGL